MFFFTPVHYVAVLIAALSSMVVGFLWYSPLLFAKPWMKLSGLDEKSMNAAKKNMPMTYTASFFMSLVMAYVTAILINSLLVSTLQEGLMLALLVWLGFVATTMVTGVLFQRVPWKLFFINSGYQLVSMLVVSAILTIWI